jgi:hypothetical protein
MLAMCGDPSSSRSVHTSFDYKCIGYSVDEMQYRTVQKLRRASKLELNAHKDLNPLPQI